jgi:hypothetical protein
MTPDRTRTRRHTELTRTQWLTRRVDAADLLAYLGVQSADADSCISVAGTLGRVVTAAGPWNMHLPHGAWVGAYGLLWALETGRLHADDYHALRQLGARDLCLLIADAAAACDRPQDVPRYIAARAPSWLDGARRDG